MRFGRILVEDSPNSLMTAYNVSTLDDVFVKLCIEDDNRDQNQVGIELWWAITLQNDG